VAVQEKVWGKGGKLQFEEKGEYERKEQNNGNFAKTVLRSICHSQGLL